MQTASAEPFSVSRRPAVPRDTQPRNLKTEHDKKVDVSVVILLCQISSS
jgi:hypothetical protein